jgi:Ni/Fe-hydrogenase subunit HybB-like protein
MLGSLSATLVVVLFLFVGVRVSDLTWRGAWPQVFGSGGYGLLLFVELGLFLAPALMLLSKARRAEPCHLFRAGMLMMLAGALYRFDSVLVAFNPGDGWSYFPTVPEMTITFGLVALEIMVYIVLVKTFPILRGIAPARAGR